MNQNIKIHSNKILAIFVIACGGFILVLAAQYRGMELQLFMGPMFILMGILLMANPTIVVTPTEIQMRNILGMTLKRHQYNASNTELRKNGLYVNDRKVRIGIGGLMHQPDVKKAVAHFKSLDETNSSGDTLV